MNLLTVLAMVFGVAVSIMAGPVWSVGDPTAASGTAGLPRADLILHHAQCSLGTGDVRV